MQIDQHIMIILKSINTKAKACCTDINILVVKKLLSLKSFITDVEGGGVRKNWCRCDGEGGLVAMVMVEAGVSEAVVIVEVVGGGGGFGHCLKIRKEEFGDLARSWGRMVAGTGAGGRGGSRDRSSDLKLLPHNKF